MTTHNQTIINIIYFLTSDITTPLLLSFVIMLHDGKKKALPADLTFKQGESFPNADDIEHGNVIKVEFDDKRGPKNVSVAH